MTINIANFLKGYEILETKSKQLKAITHPESRHFNVTNLDIVNNYCE